MERQLNNVLIIDPNQNFPSASLFFKNFDYFIDKKISFLKRYNLTCATELANNYDALCVVMDLPLVNRDVTLEWGGNRGLGLPISSPEVIEFFTFDLKKIKYNKLIIFDYSDFPLCS